MGPPLGESISKDFKRLQMIVSDSIHQSARVENYAGEMAGIYINIYDDAAEGISAKGVKRHPI